MELAFDIALDAFVDSLKLLPFLFVTYVFMEWLEHGAGRRFERTIANAGRIGPVVGALLGAVPQCGFSGAAATLYAGRVVTLGTLFAVFLATSDEMLPVMISSAAPPELIVKVLIVKVAAGIACGLVLDVALRCAGREHAGFAAPSQHVGHGANDICELCEREGCACACSHEHCVGCEQPKPHDEPAHAHTHSHAHGGFVRGILLPAARHSLNIFVFVFIILLVLNIVFELGLEDAMTSITASPAASVALAGLLGLIPNCAISVGLTQMYLEGVLSGGALIAGLASNAGVGLLVLFRTNRDVRENAKITLLLVVLGIVCGALVQVAGIF